jgi:hypothetical protein
VGELRIAFETSYSSEHKEGERKWYDGLRCFPEWPQISEYACELFGHHTFDEETWRRLRDRLYVTYLTDPAWKARLEAERVHYPGPLWAGDLFAWEMVARTRLADVVEYLRGQVEARTHDLGGDGRAKGSADLTGDDGLSADGVRKSNSPGEEAPKSQADKVPVSGGSEGDGQHRAAGRELSPTREKAYRQYRCVVDSSALGPNPTDREVYGWLDRHNDGDEMPSLDSWQRYLGDARYYYGTQKRKPRRGRPHGKSIVRANEV